MHLHLRTRHGSLVILNCMICGKQEIIFLPCFCRTCSFFPVKFASFTHHAIIQSEHFPPYSLLSYWHPWFWSLPRLGLHPILLSLCHCYFREWHDLVHHHHWVKPSWAHVLFPPHAILLGPRTMPFHIGYHGGYFLVQCPRNQLWCLHWPNVLHPWFHIHGVLGTPCNGLWSLHCHL